MHCALTLLHGTYSHTLTALFVPGLRRVTIYHTYNSGALFNPMTTPCLKFGTQRILRHVIWRVIAPQVPPDFNEQALLGVCQLTTFRMQQRQPTRPPVFQTVSLRAPWLLL